jgi:hypothetical protein
VSDFDLSLYDWSRISLKARNAARVCWRVACRVPVFLDAPNGIFASLKSLVKHGFILLGPGKLLLTVGNLEDVVTTVLHMTNKEKIIIGALVFNFHPEKQFPGLFGAGPFISDGNCACFGAQFRFVWVLLYRTLANCCQFQEN